MKILLVTDAWHPQVNGVVRSLSKTREQLELEGHDVTVLSPESRPTVPCPSYPEIRLTLRPRRAARECLARTRFDAVHVATEGPLGIAARRWCNLNGVRFTSSYHTRFPEYLRLRAPVPLSASYRMMRWFHSAAERTLVRTETQKTLLSERGFRNLHVWPGAVDTDTFRPYDKDALDLPRPISMYMGRVAPEKNLDVFLDLDLPGSQVVIGGGPALARYTRAYPNVHFLGYRHGDELARLLSAADVFVFPSLTDTLGLVILEAMACGVPVAAFPVPGPKDLIVDGGNGALDEDLREAIFRALAIPSEHCVEFAAGFSWQRSTTRFLEMLIPAVPRRDERLLDTAATPGLASKHVLPKTEHASPVP
ncbi:MAG: alpha-mannosyltransferase [Xanthomonadales bacterium]|nr:alpha-mannosyltransferase [Xanthomonadales bacterium]